MTVEQAVQAIKNGRDVAEVVAQCPELTVEDLQAALAQVESRLEEIG